jgi:hypothetical protein
MDGMRAEPYILPDETEFQIEDGVLVKYRGNEVAVTVPQGVTAIGESVFAVCKKLVSISLPEGLSSIGEKAFEGCSSLESISLPEGLTTIEKWAFCKRRSLNSISLPEGLSDAVSSSLLLVRERRLYE